MPAINLVVGMPATLPGLCLVGDPARVCGVVMRAVLTCLPVPLLQDLLCPLRLPTRLYFTHPACPPCQPCPTPAILLP